MSSSDERRRQPRISCQRLARYARGHRVQSAQLLDLSASGARLILEGAHSAPEHFRLELDGSVQLLAQTVWSQRDGQGRQQVGVRFPSQPWGWKAALDDYLRSLGANVA